MEENVRYIIEIEKEPYIRKSFLNGDELIYKIKGTDIFISEKNLRKFVPYTRLFDLAAFPLHSNEEYLEFYNLNKTKEEEYNKEYLEHETKEEEKND